ncbi:MAG: transcriptional regulator NrdR [Phycisphaerae bacterium]
MQCPYCGQDNDKVVDSRSSEGGRVVRRRRQCLACERRFTTYERPEEAVRLWVVKKGQAREPYDRSKLIHGLERACYKRPIKDEQIRQIVEATEEDIYQHFDKEVPSSFIGDIASGYLRNLDKIAYVRFASVYREFADVGDLINEANDVRDGSTIGPEQPGLFETE